MKRAEYKKMKIKKSKARNIYRVTNFKAINKKRFLEKKGAKPIGNGEQKLIRISKCELYRKTSSHTIKQVYKVTGLNAKWLREHGLNNISLKASGNVISKQLINIKALNKINGKLPFEHFC